MSNVCCEGVLWQFLPWLTCVCLSRVAQPSPGCGQDRLRAPFPLPQRVLGGTHKWGCVDVPKDGNFCLQLSLRESQRLKACPFLWPVSDYCLVSSFLWVQLLLWELTIQKKYCCLVSDQCLCSFSTRSLWAIILETLEVLVLAVFFPLHSELFNLQKPWGFSVHSAQNGTSNCF